jgi:hypothetical protein
MGSFTPFPPGGGRYGWGDTRGGFTPTSPIEVEDAGTYTCPLHVYTFV